MDKAFPNIHELLYRFGMSAYYADSLSYHMQEVSAANMKKCHCCFHDALVSKYVQSGDTLSNVECAALRKETEACCCFALLLFLIYRCDDVPAFLSQMRQSFQMVYEQPSDL